MQTAATHTRYSCGPLMVKAITVLPRSSVTRGGPVAELIRGGRWALPVWLLLAAAASPDRATVDIRWYRCFASRCLGLVDEGSGSSLRSTVSRMLARLTRLNLITVEQKLNGGVVIQLLGLDGRGGSYAMPCRSENGVIHVPTGPLFSNEWHRILSSVEIGGLLIALAEESRQVNKFGLHQWEKTRDEIAKDYGIAASTWSKAKDGLLAAGLLEWGLPHRCPATSQWTVPKDRYTVHVETLRDVGIVRVGCTEEDLQIGAGCPSHATLHGR